MTWRGRFTPADRAASVYTYAEVTVPPGTPGIAVELDYDRADAVIDLGVFDPHGFRGYSGGARRRFAITTHAATPGYLPGPVTPGPWQVLLGLHRVPAPGVEIVLDVTLGTVEVPEPAGARLSLGPALPAGSTRRLPAAPGRRWLAGDLHAHTVHSDGVLTIEQLAALAHRRGLDFCAVTDHNTVSHHPHLAEAGMRAGVTLVPGQEVTTDTGHANCFGAIGWIDFREPSDAWLAHADHAGGLLSVNHPLAGDLSWRRPLARTTPLSEVWHWTWDRRSRAPLDWWAEWGGVAIGGSDWHGHGGGERLGEPTTWVEAAGGADADVLAGLAAGRVAISASPDGPVMVPFEDALVVDRAAGLVVVDGHGTQRAVACDDPVRVEAGADPHLLVDADGLVHALAAVGS